MFFSKDARIDLDIWSQVDAGRYDRVLELVRDIQRSPFDGIGNPIPLMGSLKGFWSRRVDYCDWLVYMADDLRIVVLSCRTRVSRDAG
ncbi:Txe/YoeB family addiction module toxin [Paraburkholderia domus]|uniref:Txe/YoeB family addiction module toxin n=1 Tax=Paraburkholderia domus TaxID=2793075 RepID=UPI001914D162|nr:Txe/YoeB family addiction module toxin [Paraburkholderia domus]MBK5065760.1 Txe/YoeB family addiction module toxin [Burkholderia sp. R-70199]